MILLIYFVLTTTSKRWRANVRQNDISGDL